MDDNIEFLLKATNNYNNSYVASNGMIFTPLFDEEGKMLKTGEEVYNEWKNQNATQ